MAVIRNLALFMTRDMRERMRFLLFKTSPLPANAGVAHWLDRGTLLGASREKALIVGGYDMDIRVMHKDRLSIYRHLQHELSEELTVSAMHHGNVINEPDEGHGDLWFNNEDGEFLVTEHEGDLDGVFYHSATALIVHFRGEPWNSKPNLDLYSCGTNKHHDCMSADSPRGTPCRLQEGI